MVMVYQQFLHDAAHIITYLFYLFVDVPEEVADGLVDLAEKYVTVKMYSQLFCPTDDEQKDLQMQKVIA